MHKTAVKAHQAVCTIEAAGAAALADCNLHPVLGVVRQARLKRGGFVQVLRHVGGVGAARSRCDLPRRHDHWPCSHESDAARSPADRVASSMSGEVDATIVCLTEAGQLTCSVA